LTGNPCFEQLGGGNVGNAAPLPEATFQLSPEMVKQDWGLQEVLQPQIKSTLLETMLFAIPTPPEDAYYEHILLNRFWQFQQSDARENGYCFVAPDGKVFFVQHASHVKVVYLPRTSTSDFCPRSKPFRDFVEKLKKEDKYTPLVDDHSIQASGMFSTVAASVDDYNRDAMPEPKLAGKK